MFASYCGRCNWTLNVFLSYFVYRYIFVYELKITSLDICRHFGLGKIIFIDTIKIFLLDTLLPIETVDERNN